MRNRRLRRITLRALAILVALGGVLTTSQPTRGVEQSFDGGVPALALAQAPDAHASTAAPIAWTELGPSGLIARAITTEMTCPIVRFDGRARRMQVRATPTPPEYPVLVCEADVPASTHFASIGGRWLPLFRRDPDRIVVIGDAGCRIEGREAQACNDPAQWPFAKIAARAARWRPDLVIHVGDYLYREDPCPPGDEGCQGSPSGKTWAAIQADLFTPAAPLLRAAPWVFVRGNHETCARAGENWFRFLYPLPRPASCVDYTEPYKIPLGNLDLLILDSAITDDFQVPPDQVAAFRAQFETLRRLATGPSWLVTHKPLYVFGHAGEHDGVEQLFIDQQVLQAASENDFPSSIGLFIGGHIHLFEALSFAGKRPPQMVVGNSGTLLDPPVVTPLTGLEIAGLEVASGLNVAQFGFVTMRRLFFGAWTAVVRDVAGAPMLGCLLLGDDLDCLRLPQWLDPDPGSEDH